MNLSRHLPGRFAMLAAVAAASLLFAATLAHAGNTTFYSSTLGDVTFPFTAPKPATSTPGLIDNMTIGATTPRAGSFTALKSADGLVCTGYYQITTAAIADQTIFVATRPYIVVSVSEVHAVAAGGASVVQLVKDTGTAAPGAGIDLLTNTTNTGFNLNGTANTVQVGTLVAAATRTLAAGDRLSLDFSTTVLASSGISVTVCLAPQ